LPRSLEYWITLVSEESSDACFGRDVRNSLQELGGVEHLKSQHENVSAFHKNNYMPLMRHIHARHRSLLFRLLDLLAIGPANQDESLLKALQFVRNYRLTRRDFLPFDIDLSFAPERWKKFVSSRNNEIHVLDRRALEVCVFWHVAEELHVGNLYVEGSEEYQDYRTQLLPWEECERRLPACCAALGLPETPQAIVAALREELETVAAPVDAGFPDTRSCRLTPTVSHISNVRKKPYPLRTWKPSRKKSRRVCQSGIYSTF